MSQPTPRLPHQTDDIFLTDGGTETWLMYKRGFELPEFSAFHLLNDTAVSPGTAGILHRLRQSRREAWNTFHL